MEGIKFHQIHKELKYATYNKILSNTTVWKALSLKRGISREGMLMDTNLKHFIYTYSYLWAWGSVVVKALRY